MTEPRSCARCGGPVEIIFGVAHCPSCTSRDPGPPGMVVKADDPVATVEFEASVKLYALLKDIQIDLKRVADALDRAQPKGSPKL